MRRPRHLLTKSYNLGHKLLNKVLNYSLEAPIFLTGSFYLQHLKKNQNLEHKKQFIQKLISI